MDCRVSRDSLGGNKLDLGLDVKTVQVIENEGPGEGWRDCARIQEGRNPN